MKIQTETERALPLIEDIIVVWEGSVRATHHFLADEDIQSLKPYVKTALAEVPGLIFVAGPDGAPLGFMGVDGDKIEMLFIHPDAQGQGLGRRLIGHAVSVLDATRVDVNQQNTQAVGFL